jgi:hypothetical protein
MDGMKLYLETNGSDLIFGICLDGLRKTAQNLAGTPVKTLTENFQNKVKELSQFARFKFKSVGRNRNRYFTLSSRTVCEGSLIF